MLPGVDRRMLVVPNAAPPIGGVVRGLRPALLVTDMFTDGQPYVAGLWYRLLDYHIPSNTLVKIARGTRYRAFIKSLLAVTPHNSATPQLRAIALPGLLRTSQTLPPLPSVHHPEIVVAGRSSGQWAVIPVESVNYQTRVVTFTEPPSTTVLHIHYPFELGEWRVMVYRDSGLGDTLAFPIVTGSFSNLFTVDINNREVDHGWPFDTILTSGWRLSIEVNTPRFIALDPLARHLIEIPCLTGFLNDNDQTSFQSLNDYIERQLRGGS